MRDQFAVVECVVISAAAHLSSVSALQADALIELVFHGLIKDER